jgi:ferredoxin
MTLLPTIDPLACSAHGDCEAIAPAVVDDATGEQVYP